MTMVDGWKETTVTLTPRHEADLAGFRCWAFADGRWNVFGILPAVPGSDVMFSGHERTAELAKAKCAGVVDWLQSQGGRGQ